MNENVILGSKFARKVNKNYGVITYSGTLAIELALKCLNFEKGDNILISSEVCSSIINTIKKVGLNPVIVVPKNNIVLTDEDIDCVLNRIEISGIMLVHQYGIINNINKNKYKKMKIKIIEDIAQSWIIDKMSSIIGVNSDIVVTSFGKTKPLSYGIGGGIFYNNKSFEKYMDFYDNISREKEEILYSYMYPLCSNIDENQLMNKANKIIHTQQKNVIKYFNILKKYNYINFINIDNITNNSWHRLPIYFTNKKIFDDFIIMADKYKLKYQTQHEKRLYELPISNDLIKFNLSKEERYFVLLRTRNINIRRQLYIIEKIIKIIEKKYYVCYNNSDFYKMLNKKINGVIK